MKVVITILLITTLLIGAGSLYSVKKVLEIQNETALLGAFTTLNSIDRLTDFPATYNANLVKTIEIGTTSVASITTLSGLTSAASLSTVGTISTGVWNGTTIGMQYGGTGSTSLSQFSVLLGSSTNPVYTVSGLGTTGQFLTSQGLGAPPQWTTSAFDLQASYNLTGTWNFQSGTTTIQSLRVVNATSTIAGVSYSFPTTISASSTVLTTTATGTLVWAPAASSFKAGRGSQAKGNVNAQTITHNLGRVPVYVYFEAFGCASDGSTGHLSESKGFATSVDDENAFTYGVQGETTQLGNPTFIAASSTILSLADAGNVVEAQATLTGLTATTMTINWTTNDAAATGCTDSAQLVMHYFWQVF